MQLLTLQIIAAIFAIFAISRVYLRFKERKLSLPAFLFWFLVWVSGVIFILFPETATSFAKLVGIGRGVDAVIYASVATLFYLIFRLYIKIEETNRLITDLVQKVALKKIFVKKPTKN